MIQPSDHVLFDYSSHILILPILFDFPSEGFKSRVHRGSHPRVQSRLKTENRQKKRGLPAERYR